MRGMHDGGAEDMAGGKRMSRQEILGRVRMQVMLVRTLSGQVKELSGDGLRSLRMDGASAGRSGTYRGLEVRMEKKDALERMLRRESELLRTYEAQARAEMDAMKPEHYAFCAMYYIAGFSLEETAQAMDRSARQCARYKREIETA